MTKEGHEESGRQLSVIASTSARDEHTTFAIEKRAVDHVPKPSSTNRIRRALDAAFRCTAEERAGGLANTLPQRQSTKIIPFFQS